MNNCLSSNIEEIKWSKMGYISVFDHWLDEVEADECKILCYSIAKDSDVLDEYLDSEKKFINFYTSLSDQAYCFYKDSWQLFNTNSEKFERILKRSLREERLDFFDIYYPNYSLRFKGGHDRTDVFFIEDIRFLSDLSKAVEINGLFILSIQDYSEDLDRV